jgi:hypothetical protein
LAILCGIAVGAAGTPTLHRFFFDQFFGDATASNAMVIGFGAAILGLGLLLLSHGGKKPGPAGDNHDPHPSHLGGGGDWIICPNTRCGYHGQARKQARGSWLLAIFLFLFGGLPGILYIIIYSGYTLVCPRCGLKIRSV